jgi:hypothetical protein
MAQLKDLLVEGKSRFIDKIYASDQFISKVVQGTSPFLIDSSTLVSNLNADLVDGQHFSYTNTNNTPTYLWGTSSNGTNYLVSRASMHSGIADKVSTIASTSTFLTIPKPLTVWITTNYGKFLKRWEYQTTVLAS